MDEQRRFTNWPSPSLPSRPHIVTSRRCTRVRALRRRLCRGIFFFFFFFFRHQRREGRTFISPSLPFFGCAKFIEADGKTERGEAQEETKWLHRSVSSSSQCPPRPFSVETAMGAVFFFFSSSLIKVCRSISRGERRAETGTEMEKEDENTPDQQQQLPMALEKTRFFFFQQLRCCGWFPVGCIR